MENHDKILKRFGIDRPTLGSAGIRDDTIDRIYRALFVYSVGFHELLKKSTFHAQNKHLLHSNIFRAFSVLLEFCCKYDYQLLINQITQQFQEQIQGIEDAFKEQIKDQEQVTQDLRNKLDSLESDYKRLMNNYTDSQF